MTNFWDHPALNQLNVHSLALPTACSTFMLTAAGSSTPSSKRGPCTMFLGGFNLIIQLFLFWAESSLPDSPAKTNPKNLRTQHQLNIRWHLRRRPAWQTPPNPHPYTWSKNPYSERVAIVLSRFASTSSNPSPKRNRFPLWSWLVPDGCNGSLVTTGACQCGILQRQCANMPSPIRETWTLRASRKHMLIGRWRQLSEGNMVKRPPLIKLVFPPMYCWWLKSIVPVGSCLSHESSRSLAV